MARWGNSGIAPCEDKSQNCNQILSANCNVTKISRLEHLIYSLSKRALVVGGSLSNNINLIFISISSAGATKEYNKHNSNTISTSLLELLSEFKTTTTKSSIYFLRPFAKPLVVTFVGGWVCCSPQKCSKCIILILFWNIEDHFTLRDSVTRGRSCTRLTCWSSQLEVDRERSPNLILGWKRATKPIDLRIHKSCRSETRYNCF